MLIIGASPSGKATDSDSVIRGFKSLCPNQMTPVSRQGFFRQSVRSIPLR